MKAVKVIEKQEDVLYATGWDDCLVGHGSIFHGSDGPKTVAVYDRNKMVARMAKEMMDDHIGVGSRTEEMEEDNFWSEADEYISFNVEGSFIQSGMPVFACFEKEVNVVEGY